VNEIEKRHELDTSGLSCPEPVMLLHGAVRDAGKGDIIIVTATDPSTLRDIPKFCNYLGHDLLSSKETKGVFTYEIRKG
jgi:tRNA 2-thiouridine synthesizing protein A